MDESTLEELITVAEDAVAAVEEAVVAVEDAVSELGDEAPEELIERARKLRAGFYGVALRLIAGFCHGVVALAG